MRLGSRTRQDEKMQHLLNNHKCDTTLHNSTATPDEHYHVSIIINNNNLYNKFEKMAPVKYQSTKEPDMLRCVRQHNLIQHGTSVTEGTL